LSCSGQQARAGVDFVVQPGEVHALIGENGSGKSTLIKTLAGYPDPDAYEKAEVDGEPFTLGSSSEAGSLGLRFIHQNLGLLENMSALENCSLARGFPTAPGYRIRWGQERRRVHDLLLEFGVDIDPDVPVGRLKPAERTAVAIVRALQDWEHTARLLVLDEATASLPPPEVAHLFSVIRQVTAKGIGVVYVSHRLDEVFEIADQVTVIRDGRNVATKAIGDLDHDELVSLMIGRPVEALFAEPPPPSTDVVLSVRNLSGDEVEDLSFDARAGEIVGFAGILGSGREEVADLLFGARPALTGTVTINGAVAHDLAPEDAIALGMGMVPSDRGARGALSTFSITENMTITRLRGLTRGGRIRRGAERAEAKRWVDRFEIRPGRIDAALGTLSGGNQQKVILAKWLRIDPTVLVLDEPTHGVDVGAKAAIYQLIADRARDGLAVVICSTESEELAHVCDRVLVLRGGRVVVELEGAALTAERITREVLGSATARAGSNPAEVSQ
jgi:ribose transport system ATP-binding protein